MAKPAPREVHVEYMELAAIKAARINPKDHDLEAIARSIATHGFVAPLVLDEKTGRLVAGHGRLAALIDLWGTGADTPRGIQVDGEHWLAPVIRGVSFPNAKAAQAYLLADNHLTERGGWDTEALLEALQDMAAADMLEATGFEQRDVDALVLQLGGPPERPGANDLPERPPARTKPGDLWLLGEHRLLCGDATVTGDVDYLMNGELAAAIFTDPPYNVAYVGAAGAMENDDQADDDFAQFLAGAFFAMNQAAEPGAAIYVCHPDSGGHVFRQAFIEGGFLLKQCLVWVKDSFALSRQDYNWQHEPILYGWKPGAAHRWFGDFAGSTVIDDDRAPATLRKDELVAILEGMRESATVIRAAKPGRSTLHPTMKPVELITKLLRNSVERGDLVLDPFGGSGSTLIAAEQSGMRCNLLELDPHYADIIVTRWEDFTGKTATRG